MLLQPRSFLVLLLPLAVVQGAAAGQPRSGDEVVGLYPEFRAGGALVLGLSEMVERHPKTLVDILVALDDRLPVIGVVANGGQLEDVQSLVKEAGAPVMNLELVQVPIVGMWMRDYGPGFVRLPDNRFVVTDAIYGREGHVVDDWIPRYLAGYLRLPVVDVPLRVFGGNFLTNGEGWIIATTQLIEFNEKDGYSRDEIGQLLAAYYGAENWLVIDPLVGEPTQHADMFLTLLAPDVAVVSTIDPELDAVNAERLDEAAERVASVRTRSGPMKVVRVPMPGHEDGKWRSYTNVIFAAGTLLVPSYPDKSPEMDRQALRIYRELLPEWRVVPVDASSLIQKNGSLHCISINVPELP